MGMYLNAKKQKEMIRLMLEYQEISDCGKKITHRSNMLMNKFFKNYADLIIMGVIFSNTYKFWRFAEVDDLVQEGRMALISSIHKKQWDPERGTIFNFFTTVVAWNLMNYTTKHNKFEECSTDIDILFNNKDMTFHQNFDKIFLMKDVFKQLKLFFKGKPKFVKLTKLLEHYFYDNRGKRFVKRKFIEFAKAYNFSPAITNTFFSYCKRCKYIRKEEMQELLNFEGEQYEKRK